jgi:glycosyltransferase involved in cell wall biosynthesis
MRVAVVFPAGRPEDGGSHTFQQTVAQAIFANTHPNRHEFVFFEDDAGRFRAPRPIRKEHGFVSVGVPANRGARVVRKAQFLFNQVQDTVLHSRPLDVDTALVRLLRQQGIEFVWFATPHFLECPIPYLATIFDLQHQNQPWFPEVGDANRWTIRETVTRRAVTRATAVIVANEQAKSELLRAYPIGADRVLKLSHPTPQFALDAAKLAAVPYPQHLGLSGKYMLYPAQFWAHKNHVTLLKAFQRVRLRHPDMSLVLVGADKGNRAHVESSAARLGVAEQIHFFGFVDQRDLVALYQHAQVLAYPSLFGPENLPPLEAFALGLPVVCANYAGAQAQLGDAAVLVSPLDVDAWVDALDRVLSNDSERAGMLIRGKRRASELSADHYVASVLTFLDGFALIRENWK